MADPIVLKPQEGPQEEFLRTSADICFYGGAAGGGKTWGLLLECIRHIETPGFGAVIFRRTSNQVRNEGGLWDESEGIFPHVGGAPKESILTWDFKETGNSITFAHLEHEKNKYDWQGSQIPLICFDEVTHFTGGQFWYLASRNRSMCGVKPYIRATCNPDPDSWVADFIKWWIDQETGYAIPERSGVIRWMLRRGGRVHWADTKEELVDRFWKAPYEEHEKPQPKSITFIASSVYDNKALLKVNPEYLGNLDAQTTVERERLKYGNWKIRAKAGLIFNREQFIGKILDRPPHAGVIMRYWDRAGTDRAKNPNSDYTVGVKLMKDSQGRYIVLDVEKGQWEATKVFMRVKMCAELDGRGVEIGLEEEPGASGKFEIAYYKKNLAGYIIRHSKPSKRKIVRWGPVATQADAGNLYLVRGHWNKEFLDILENLSEDTEDAHDDEADALAGAFELLYPRSVKTRVASGSPRQLIHPM